MLVMLMMSLFCFVKPGAMPGFYFINPAVERYSKALPSGALRPRPHARVPSQLLVHLGIYSASRVEETVEAMTFRDNLVSRQKASNSEIHGSHQHQQEARRSLPEETVECPSNIRGVLHTYLTVEATNQKGFSPRTRKSSIRKTDT